MKLAERQNPSSRLDECKEKHHGSEPKEDGEALNQEKFSISEIITLYLPLKMGATTMKQLSQQVSLIS